MSCRYRLGMVSKVSHCPPSFTHSRPLTTCHRCRAFPDQLEQAGRPRFRAHTEKVVETFSPAIAWDVFGINADVRVRGTRSLTDSDYADLRLVPAVHELFSARRHP